MIVIDRRKVLRTLSYTALFNTMIAVFLTILKFGGGIVVNFIFSQCIGISICICILFAHHFLKTSRPGIQLAIIMTAMTVGAVGGTIVGSVASGIGLANFFKEYGFFIQAVVIGILFGSMITHFFFSRARISASQALLQEERIKRLTSEKRGVETNLRLLQAQIEPHFLFNTLSNVLSLLDTDLKKGKNMLMDLIHYLRTSLKKTRVDITTVGQEIEMIRAYLNIFRVRMEDRLRYRINIPDSIRELPFPPMLVQPLVENAIKHGLEPSIKGGEVSIHAEIKEDILRLEIADTGLGFHEGTNPSIGLSNVRDRLQSLYGEKGRLILEENQPSGLKSIIEVPYVRDQGNHRR